VENCIGEENGGWQMRRAIGGRGPSGVGPNDQAVARRHLHQLVAYCKDSQPHVGRLFDKPTVRHTLADLLVENAVLRWLTYRMLAGGATDNRAVAGESVGILRREHMQRTARAGVTILGLRGTLLPEAGPWAPMASWFARQYLYSVPATIYGGTVEIHRELVARALGLPRS
jgi:alkylation response protein AidB-like acyl-CoA dehydrogenase